VLLSAGDHVPSIPLFDVVGKAKELPVQIAETSVNVGTINGELDITQVQVVVLKLAVSLHAVAGCSGWVPVTSQVQVVVLKLAVS
jgi:hypothetical protein